MATSKQLNNIIKVTKKRVARLAAEVAEAKKKISELTADYKEAVATEKAEKAEKAASRKR